MQNILLAFILTTLAGLSTILGALLVFSFKKINNKIIAFGLGFSAGAMLYISFFELLKDALVKIDKIYVLLAFIMGLIISAGIDNLTHILTKSWFSHTYGDKLNDPKNLSGCLMKTGLITAIAIGLHNFPEGIATFTTTTANATLGISIAIAVAIHNIPEGLCIALPIYCSTKSKFQSFLYTLIAGLAEPAGALITYFILSPFINNEVLGFLFSLVAGIMVYVALDELLPTANKLSERHITLLGIICGFAVIALSLFLL